MKDELSIQRLHFANESDYVHKGAKHQAADWMPGSTDDQAEGRGTRVGCSSTLVMLIVMVALSDNPSGSVAVTVKA